MSNNSDEKLNWGLTSQDYVKYRPGYPDNYFVLLKCLGVGLKNQDILDLGSGTGALAIPFAKQGANVTALDSSQGQLDAAKDVAVKNNLNIKFIASNAEETNLPNNSFDVITSSMCWLYFDQTKITDEVIRLLRRDGLLMISYMIWLPDENEILKQTLELIFKYNKECVDRNNLSHEEILPEWSKKKFKLKTFHGYKANIPFTKESWRGRIRACKWIGAALPPDKVNEFDQEHARILEKFPNDNFEINHRIQIQIFTPKHEKS